MGPGETGQARALAKYIVKSSGKIIFALCQKKNLHFLAKDKKFKIFFTENPCQLKDTVGKEKPDVILFFNSKMWGSHFQDFQITPPFKKPLLTFCVDSNWLFNEKTYPDFRFIKWADKYLILFPKKIFESGLKENGGGFTIPHSFLKKVLPIGFMPSYEKPKKKAILETRRKYEIEKDEKFIFSYFSGFGAGHRIWAFYNLIEAVDRLVKKGKKIKVLYVGPIESLDKKMLQRDWLMKKDGLSADDYFLTLASSDLVFQHQGMVTLSQAISANVPVIANVSVLKEVRFKKLHIFEVGPFNKAGLCDMLTKNTPCNEISKKIEELLYNNISRKKMIKKQRELFQRGEITAYKFIQKKLKNL